MAGPALGTRAVVYAKTGSSEVVSGLPGCRVFAEHEAGSAIEALENALREEPQRHLYREVLSRYSDVEAFHRRLESVFQSRDN